jgi:hypothetical protein
MEDPQILGAIVQRSVTQVTWHPGFGHPWVKKGVEVICSSASFCCPFKVRHVTLEQEQHQPGQDA